MTIPIDAQTAIELAEIKRTLDRLLPKTSAKLFDVIDRFASDYGKVNGLLMLATEDGLKLEKEVARLRAELQAWVQLGMNRPPPSEVLLELLELEGK